MTGSSGRVSDSDDFCCVHRSSLSNLVFDCDLAARPTLEVAIAIVHRSAGPNVDTRDALRQLTVPLPAARTKESPGTSPLRAGAAPSSGRRTRRRYRDVAPFDTFTWSAFKKCRRRTIEVDFDTPVFGRARRFHLALHRKLIGRLGIIGTEPTRNERWNKRDCE